MNKYYCPNCSARLIPESNTEEHLTNIVHKLCHHDLPNITNHAESLEKRLTSLESLVSAIRNTQDTLNSSFQGLCKDFNGFSNAAISKDSIIELIEDHLSNTGPESPLADHINATIDSYLDQYDFANEINNHLNNAEIKIII